MSEYVEASSGGTAKATAEHVTMVIDEVKRIAHKTMGDLTDQAGHHRAAFGTAAKVDHAAFGQVPKAQHLATHQEAARKVFVDTYQGVITDLENFRANLLACAEAHQANDESVQAGLLAISARANPRAFASNREYTHSREEHGKQLGQGHDATADGSGTPSAAAGADDPRTDTETSAQSGGAGHADAPTPHSYS